MRANFSVARDIGIALFARSIYTLLLNESVVGVIASVGFRVFAASNDGGAAVNHFRDISSSFEASAQGRVL